MKSRLLERLVEEDEIANKVVEPKEEFDKDSNLAQHRDIYIKGIFETACGGNKAAGARMYDAYKESGKDLKTFLIDFIDTIKKSGVLYSIPSNNVK